jgi:methylthioribose-1-phosphate isomerase
MPQIDEQIQQFLLNRTSGAEELSKQALEIIKKLYHLKNREERITEFLRKSAEQFHMMVPILKIAEFFSENPINTKNINKIENAILDKSYIKNADFLFSKKVKILAFSNSSSVRNVVHYYSDRIEQVFCCHSLPLGEGEYLHKFFEEQNINSTLIEDSEISKILKGVDFIIIGADAITKNYFVNKIGSLQLVLLANYFQKPVYVVASKSKIIDADRLDISKLGPYFEKVDNKLVTKFTI